MNVAKSGLVIGLSMGTPLFALARPRDKPLRASRQLLLLLLRVDCAEEHANVPHLPGAVRGEYMISNLANPGG